MEIMTYIIKSIIVLTLLYVPYMLLLRKESFFRFNRRMLLGIMALSFVLPLLDIPLLDMGIHPFAGKPEIAIGMPTVVGIEGGPLSNPTAQTAANANNINWWTVLVWIYAGGIIITALVKAVQLITIHRRIHRGVLWADSHQVATIYCHGENISPFSWFRCIVISEKDYEQNGDVIIRHEMGHIRHHHSIDMLLVNAIQLLQWANPFVWMLGGAMRDIHEYEADDTVLRSGVNAREYMSLLMRKAVGSSSYAFANGFNHSLLKKRITMMLRKKSNPLMRTKALYVIPVAVLALSAFATPIISSQKQSDSLSFNDADSKVTEIIPDKKISEPESYRDNLVNATDEGVSESERKPLTTDKQREDDIKPFSISSADEINVPISFSTNTTTKEVMNSHPSVTQTIDTVPPVKYSATMSPISTNTDDPVLDVCEQLPEYPGGFDGLMQELFLNIRYPEIAHKNGVEGKIDVQFIVEKDGNCSNIEIAKAIYNQQENKGETEGNILSGYGLKEESVSQESISVVGYGDKSDKNPKASKEVISTAQKALCDEATRVVKLLKPFKPGMQDGKPVRVRFNLPIIFKLK
jgi:hypothetical protein